MKTELERPSPPVEPPAPLGRPRPRFAWLGVVLGLVLTLLAVGVRTTGALDRFLDRTGPAAAPEAPELDAGAGPGAVAEVGPPTPTVFHRLRVVSHPEAARLVVRGADGFERSATTPFRGRVPEGEVTLTLSLPGHNRLEETITLDRGRAVELWLDPRGLLHHQVGEFSTGPNPKQVAFSPDGTEIWVTDLGGHGVEVFDAGTFELLGRITLGRHGAVEVIFARDGSTVFASQMETASVYEIDRATREVRRQMLTTGSWSKVMALSPDETRLYVSNWVSDDVSEFDLATGEELRRIPTVDTPRGLYVSPDGTRLYVAGFGRGELQRIDLSTGRGEVLWATGGAMRHLVGDAEGRYLYADDMATDEVFVVDLATDRVRKLADTDNTPNTIDISPDGKVLYVSNRGRNNPECYCLPGPEWGSVLAIDTATGRLLDAIVGGNQTTGLDVSPDGRFLAFSDFLDNRVSVFAVPEYEVLESGDGGRSQERLADIQK